ncbi:putative tyrosine carboxypeptidase MATCAP2 [Seriola aureovittata]|uniref:putative tyrosine carboxypeptidase MATCAP2 n=1 Tax=Seriola aureovittata TaxID=2871759 RepID=UPI0024BD920E|nr:putative tyrosine carboxypeptidase MATCAP2 [Seriola aureovittata]
MLESIKVTERLHWPEAEMSKKYILNSADKVVSPSQVYLEKISSSVLKDLFSTGSSSCNILLQGEEEDWESPKQSLGPKTSEKCGATLGKRNLPSMAFKKVRAQEGSGKPAQTNCVFSDTNSSFPKPARSIAVVGSTMGLIPRTVPQLRKMCFANTPHTKLPSLHKAALKREVENAKKLCILTAIKPTNVEKEKAKFFKSHFSYNPQFEYSNPVSPLVLARHNNASDRFLTQAVHIMELALLRYGSYEKFEQVTGGNLLTKSRIWHNVKKYMEKEGCIGEIVVQVTDDLLSRASMTVVNSRPTLTINISTAREHWLEGMLRHEIGTHYFRGINNCHQPWSSSMGRKKHNLKPLNPTEEGLASIHSVLFRKDPTLWRAALLYYTVYQASHMSFSQLFHNLGRFVQDPNTRWDYCVRAKRGQTDTAQPGCFSKDQVYLDGILKILRYRDKINFPLLMALGKVSFEDVDRLEPVAQMENIRIPHFMQDQGRYAEELMKIMVVNQLNDEELKTII